MIWLLWARYGLLLALFATAALLVRAAWMDREPHGGHDRRASRSRADGR
jgi:hypothetical protein